MLRLDYPRNVRDLVFRGFLTLRVDLAGKQIVLKSLNEREHQTVETLSGYSIIEINEADEAERQIMFPRWLSWALTWSTFSVDDVNLLLERESLGWYRELLDFYRNLPLDQINTLSNAISYLSAWYAFEFSNLERFSVEPNSRNLWVQYKNHLLCDPRITLVPGTQYLGLSQHQIQFATYLEGWVSQVEWEGRWEIGKMVAASFNSKYVKRVNEKDKHRRLAKRVAEQELREKGPVAARKLEDLANMEDSMIAELRDGVKDNHAKFVAEHDTTLKTELFFDRLGTEMYYLMYGRRKMVKDIGVVGHVRMSDLPEGEFDSEEAQVRAKECLKELNLLGKIAAPLEFSDGQLGIAISRAAAYAKQHHELKLQSEKEISSDIRTTGLSLGSELDWGRTDQSGEVDSAE